MAKIIWQTSVTKAQLSPNTPILAKHPTTPIPK